MSGPPPHPMTPAEQEPRTRVTSELFQRKRLTLFGVALAIELGIFFGAMVYPMDQAQQQALLQQANGLVGSTTGQGSLGIFATIFGNNVRVALLEMIPVVGAFLFVLSIFTTGQVIQALAMVSNLPGLVFGVALFFFPFAIVEFSAYAIAVASGSMVLAAWRRKRLRSEVRIFGLEAALVVVFILLAAAMETVGIVSPFVSFALWLPTAIGLTAVVVLFRGGKS